MINWDSNGIYIYINQNENDEVINQTKITESLSVVPLRRRLLTGHKCCSWPWMCSRTTWSGWLPQGMGLGYRNLNRTEMNRISLHYFISHNPMTDPWCCHIWIYMVTWIPSIYPSHVSIYTIYQLYTIHGSYTWILYMDPIHGSYTWILWVLF